MICPRCGNQIPQSAHGICHTCQRINKERQRYGRRRPKRRPSAYSSSGTSRGSGSKVTCKICGKKVRSDRLSSHKWHAHGVRPYSSDESKLLRQKQSHKQITPVDNSLPKDVLRSCPICNYSLPATELPAHLRHHGLESAKHQVVEASARKPMTSIIRRRRQRVARTQRQPIHKKAKTPTHFDIGLRKQGINQLLQEIYGHPRLLSHILRAGGLNDKQINRLHDHHLSAYLLLVVRGWNAWWKASLPPLCRQILVQRYSLTGQPAPTPKELGAKYGISGQEVRQLQKRSLNSLRIPAHRQKLEKIAVQAARTVLGQPGRLF